MRKTIPVSTVIERANHFLSNSEDAQTAERVKPRRTSWRTLLHDADAYAGFGYLASAKVVHHYDRPPAEQTTIEDETRRVYFFKRGLR
jgi:hypothetical protein